MERFILSTDSIIPAARRESCETIRKYIMEFMKISISAIDTYLLWCKISEGYDREWLDEKDNLIPHFIRDEMLKYGFILKTV